MRWLSLTVLSVSLLFIAVSAAASQHYDFRAFYCAGQVARSGADPYRTQPLYTCEQTVTQKSTAWLTNGPLPAPFPPYVVAAVFEPISLLPYRSAAQLWSAALFLALALSVLLLAKSAGCRPALPAAALCLSAGVASVSFGEIVPLFFVFLCGSMYAAQRKLWPVAGALACGTLIEPHLGVPVCLALALFQPRCRLTIATGLGTLAVVSFAAAGWSRTIEYLQPVLHYHALSEIGSDRQFAFSTVLHWLGVRDAAALAGGTISYIAALFAGIAVARRLERKFDEPAFLVAAPAAFALLGGVFIHVTQMIAALPLALLLLRVLPHAKVSIAGSLALLSIPWVWQLNPLVAAVGLFVAFAVPWEACGTKAALAAAAPAAACVALFIFTAAPVERQPAARAHITIDPSFAERGWAEQNSRYLSTGSADAWARRAPTWAGLIVILGVCVAACSARRPDRARATSLTPAFVTAGGGGDA